MNGSRDETTHAPHKSPRLATKTAQRKSPQNLTTDATPTPSKSPRNLTIESNTNENDMET